MNLKKIQESPSVDCACFEVEHATFVVAPWDTSLIPLSAACVIYCLRFDVMVVRLLYPLSPPSPERHIPLLVSNQNIPLPPQIPPVRSGKVMGLAPWALEWPSTDSPVPPLTSGSLLSNRTDGDAFRVEWNAIEQLPRPNELEDRESRPFYAALAATAQGGLEDTAMAFITGLRERTGEKNVCLCGGVALNSVLNGKVAREVTADLI